MRTLKKQIKQTKSRTRPITTGNNLMVAREGQGRTSKMGEGEWEEQDSIRG